MGLLALITGVAAVATGLLMRRRTLGLRTKLRIASVVVVVHAALAALAPQLTEPRQLAFWIVVAGASLGDGVPATFGLAVDLVPVRHRGYVVAAITRGLLRRGCVRSGMDDRRVRGSARVADGRGGRCFALLAWLRNPLVTALATQHTREALAVGGFLRGNRSRRGCSQPTSWRWAPSSSSTASGSCGSCSRRRSLRTRRQARSRGDEQAWLTRRRGSHRPPRSSSAARVPM